jgi:hypothetical protein
MKVPRPSDLVGLNRTDDHDCRRALRPVKDPGSVS